ncbi:MAG: DUF61 family protein [Candidatus Hodarchaeales archaeon]
MSNFKRTLDFLVSEISDFSKELPVSKKTLADLLLEKKPFFVNRKSREIILSRTGLNKLARLVPERHHSSIKLPFIFICRGDHFYFTGAAIEKFVIEILIDLHPQDDVSRTTRRFFAPSFKPKYEYYYGYMVKRVRKRIPSLVLIAYSMG